MEVLPGNAPGSFLHTNKNQMKSDVGRKNSCNRFSRDTANWKALNNTATLQSRFCFLLLAETNSGLLLFEGE